MFLCSLETFLNYFQHSKHLCFIFKYDAAEIHLPEKKYISQPPQLQVMNFFFMK